MENTILSRLGLHGMGEIEDLVIAGLVTGDPVLLVGRHGAAKTLTCARLAAALGLKFHAYDASKALFEDILGFPNPESLARGELDYVPTSLSIWDKEFVLVDEISRANPSMQNKWLEVIRGRQIMGRKAASLRHVFAAMNPPGYVGTTAIDDALAGRFAFIIEIPDVRDMTPGEMRAVIRHVASDDAPCLANGRFKPPAEIGAELRGLVERARGIFDAVKEKYDDRATSYVMNVHSALSAQGHPQDGRRYAMVRRNLLAHLAVKAARRGAIEFTLEEIVAAFGECLEASLPFRATAEKLNVDAVDLAHAQALRLLFRPDKRLEARLAVFNARGMEPFVDAFLSHRADLAKTDYADAVSHLEKLTAAELTPGDALRAFRALRKFLAAVQDGPAAPPDAVRRAYHLRRKLSSTASPGARVTILSLLESYPPTTAHATPEARLALRLTAARFDSYDHDRDVGKAVEFHRAVRAAINLKEGA